MQEHSDEAAHEPQRGEVSEARNPPARGRIQKRGDPSHTRARFEKSAPVWFGMTKEERARDDEGKDAERTRDDIKIENGA